MSAPFRLRLPATSANLGPGFDAAAVALDFYLDLEAELAAEFSIHASGRDALRCSRLDDNLVLEVYRDILTREGKPVLPLAIRMANDIPLGMGCGSSAAARLAGIALAVCFGGLNWTNERILAEATALEGHPDNVAACWLGGFVTAATEGQAVYVARVTPPENWAAIVVVPPAPLATSKARAVLPESCSRADAVANLQAVSLLALAFAQKRGDLLRVAMRDRLHQPYRSEICPLLPRLLPLAGTSGILGAALSGAGPAMLVILEGEGSAPCASLAIRKAASGLPEPELKICRFESRGAADQFAHSCHQI